MNENQFNKAIKKMSDMIFVNQGLKKHERTFPVSCVIMDKDGQILSKKINKKREDESNSHHAESLALNEIISRNLIVKNLMLFVTVPPCEFCFAEMIDKFPKTKWKIFYLNDDVRNKLNNKFWEEWKNTGNKITRLYINRLSEKESRLRLLYCVDKVIEGFASHKNNDERIIKTKRKVHRKRMQKYFKSSRPSKGQIETDWVYNFYMDNK